LTGFPGTFVSARDSYIRDDSDPGATFQKLVDSYYESLFRFAMSLTGKESDACDLVQDTFVKWAEKGDQLRDQSKAKSWLFTTLHRRFLETQRHMVRFPHLELEEVSWELPVFEAEAVIRLSGTEIVTMLNQVDPRYRAAVSLFYLEDNSYAEIAAVLDIPVGTVKSRISRGLSQLKALMSAADQPGRGKEHSA
jgi:RNA polymerase sigma factor (sigma-70 family)